MSCIIQIENLSHRYADGTVGVDRITLDIEAGAFVVIAGANGSGKTTLLRHLNGLLLPGSGTVRVAGLSVTSHLMRVRALVGMVFQDADSQIVGETVSEDVAFGPENLKLERAEISQRVADALAVTGLAELSAKRSHLLSGGEKRRLSIAGIIAMRPRVVVLDEPFSNLDYAGVRQVLSQIVQLHRSGHTIIVATHDLDKVLAHANRLLIMRSGQIVRDGRPGTLVSEVENFGVKSPRAAELGMEALSWLS